jgi:dTDP-4-dehydrorhamnose 3,5-epimerase
MNITTTPIIGVKVISFEYFPDERGFFAETYRKDIFDRAGITDTFTQDSHSRSKKNVVRGLHFQWDPKMSKTMRTATGAIFAVAVDLRKTSPTFGKWFGAELSESNGQQIYVPFGCASGFCVLTDAADVMYKQTGHHNPSAASGIRWDDPAIKIAWPVKDPIVSEKDRSAQTLDEWLARPESDRL